MWPIKYPSPGISSGINFCGLSYIKFPNTNKIHKNPSEIYAFINFSGNRSKDRQVFIRSDRLGSRHFCWKFLNIFLWKKRGTYRDHCYNTQLNPFQETWSGKNRRRLRRALQVLKITREEIGIILVGTLRRTIRDTLTISAMCHSSENRRPHHRKRPSRTPAGGWRRTRRRRCANT